MKLRLIVLVSLCAFGFGTTATAGTIADADSDTIPDVFDNCTLEANGPADNTNQRDSDSPTDGYGDVCDGDLTGDGLVGGTDFNAFVPLFGGGNLTADFTGDGLVGGTDFNKFVTLFGGVPGPSGLGCAGTPGCI